MTEFDKLTSNTFILFTDLNMGVLDMNARDWNQIIMVSPVWAACEDKETIAYLHLKYPTRLFKATDIERLLLDVKVISLMETDFYKLMDRLADLILDPNHPFRDRLTLNWEPDA